MKRGVCGTKYSAETGAGMSKLFRFQATVDIEAETLEVAQKALDSWKYLGNCPGLIDDHGGFEAEELVMEDR